MSTYTVQPGDTLVGVARIFLGDGGRWREIQLYNQKLLVDPANFAVGMVLTLPPGAAIPGRSKSSKQQTAGAAGTNRARALRKVARSGRHRRTRGSDHG